VRPVQQTLSLPLKRRSTTDWIDLISQAWTQRTADTLADNLELARLVSRARESLRARGEWSHLFGPGQSGLPFSKRKAEHFVRIGEIFGECANANTCAQFPPGWRILSCLAGLGWPLVERLVSEGRIHPRLSLNAAKTLLAGYFPESLKKNPQSSFNKRFDRFSKFARAAFKSSSPEERRIASRKLLNLAQDIAPTLHQLSKSRSKPL